MVTSQQDDYLVIPPLDEESTRVGFCTSDCTQQQLPAEGVTVLAHMLHMHLAGVKVRKREDTQGAFF